MAMGLAIESQYLYLLVKVRTNSNQETRDLSSEESQYLYLLVKVRTHRWREEERAEFIAVAIPIPSGEGQNIKLKT